MDYSIKMDVCHTNPLLIDLIVDKVFSYVSQDRLIEGEALRTLLNCRLVCQQWDQLSRPKIEKIAYIVLTSAKLISRPHCVRVGARQLECYMDYLKTEPKLKFTNFQLIQLALRDELTKEFFKKEGRRIDYISLCYSANHLDFDASEFRELLRTIGRNLTHLDIQTLPFLVAIEGFCKFDWDDTLLNNLETLSISLPHPGSEAFYKDLLTASPVLKKLKITAQFGAPLELKEFVTLVPTVVGKHLKNVEIFKNPKILNFNQILALATLPLATLSIKKSHFLIYNERGVDEFTRFLEQLSPTLKYLQIDQLIRARNPSTTYALLTFPVMPKLLELVLYTYDEPLYISPINYNKLFPNLLDVDLQMDDTNIDAILSESCNVPHTILRTLRLRLMASESNTLMQITRAGHMFPKIKSLILETGRVSANRLIFSLWPQLEALDITFHYYLDDLPITNAVPMLPPDCLFTGLSKDVCKMIRTLGFKFQEANRFPSVANLTKLLSLRIRTGPYEESDEFDVETGVSDPTLWAMLQLCNLELIELPTRNSFSFEALQNIRDKGVTIFWEKISYKNFH